MPDTTQHAETERDSGPPMLSQFEYDILRRMLDDFDTGRICADIDISPVTMKIAVDGIMQRLGTRTLAGTAARAIRLGIIV